ncbi:MAG: FAD-binding oxidoreductase, partial [Flavobacteriales bacterium]|nr:FAD-binding oxidoreductase [Flavobacteriales bacterium]
MLRMHFNKVSRSVITALVRIVGNEHVHTNEEKLKHYGHDETEDLSFPPEAVVRPNTAEEVAEVLRICNEHHVPVTPIGGRTGLSGGALSVHGGVGLDLDRMNRIVSIDERNL